jgi:hypothetical protein
MNKHQRQAIAHVLSSINREVESYEGIVESREQPGERDDRVYCETALAAWTAARDAVVNLRVELRK